RNVTEGAKRKIQPTQAAVEGELLWPLLRGREVVRWAASPQHYILMTQDPDLRRGIQVERMEGGFPKAHSYLSRFEGILRSRPAFHRYFSESDPYWSMFNIGPSTFARWKVVWREVANEVDAAVIGTS